MHQEQMIMVRLQGQPFQYEEGCPIPVIHNDQSFILEPLLLKFFFAFLSIFFCISAGTTLCICGSSLVHQYLSIPCTKNNDNKDKEYLPPRIMIKKIKNLAPRIMITMIKKYLAPRLMMKKIKNTPCTQQYHRYPNVVIIIIVPCTSSDQ